MEKQLIAPAETLPAQLKEAFQVALVGHEYLAAKKAELKVLEKMGAANELRQEKLQQAQDITDQVIDAEITIDKLIASLPEAPGR